MRYGFKAHAKRLAVELRTEIELSVNEPFDPWKLAQEYGIDIVLLGELNCSAEARQHFLITRPAVFSGALIPGTTGATIIENDGHLLVRRRSTVSHEMAHVVLEHKFSTSLVNERGCRTSDRDQEAEATELAGELLLPASQALRLARRGVSNEVAADQFLTSVEMAKWRLDATGAREIVKRQRAAYRRALP